MNEMYSHEKKGQGATKEATGKADDEDEGA